MNSKVINRLLLLFAVLSVLALIPIPSQAAPRVDALYKKI